MVQRVPYTGGERESLQASLNRHRDAVVWKLQGLDDAELRRAMLPSGNTLLGLVKHLATWEYIWICRTFGHPTEQLPIEEGDDDADGRIDPGDSTAGILAFYSRARAAADQVIGSIDLDEAGTTMFGDTVSLRWAVIHILEDTARHAGTSTSCASLSTEWSAITSVTKAPADDLFRIRSVSDRHDMRFTARLTRSGHALASGSI